MNILEKKYIKFKNSGIKVRKEKRVLRIINATDRHGYIIFTKILKKDKYKTANLEFEGDIIRGNGAKLQIFNFRRNVIAETQLNATATCLLGSNAFFFAIWIDARTEVVIKKVNVEFSTEKSFPVELAFGHILESNNEILIITPSYPTEENKYFGGFVHSRAKAYKQAGLKFDLVCAHNYPNTCRYSFEGVEITRTDFMGLRQVLTSKKYKTVLLHFFDDRYAQILDACDMSETNLYLWVHGPETLYWDWSKMTDPYFVPESNISSESRLYFERLDRIVRRYNDYSNVKWVFVSEWIKNHSEELIGIKFKNSIVIPNFVDEKNFKYEEKDPELRKKIIILRRFENISKYAIDVDVRVILELSRRDLFEDLEFNIYGTGAYYDTLLAPVKKFDNVKLHQNFLSHNDIAAMHRKNGIALFATRYDAQGVSMCEAAMSGLAIVSSQNDAIAEFLPYEEGILCDTENYVAYADLIEKMYKEQEYFQKVSKACHDKVYEKCSFDKTISREITMIKTAEQFSETININSSSNKILSVIVPAYNVSKYLFHGVETMLNHENVGKMEIVIVNDGSNDGTLSVAKKLQEIYSNNIIRIIDKENGGHGSAINEGLKVIKGKYIRVIDGDDWVDSLELGRLIDILENETADIIVTNYCEDRAAENVMVEHKLYQFMQPGKQYQFDDLCYEGYGFGEWGPILATANFRKEILENTVVLTEKSFYVDMEFDAFAIANAKTIVYYPLDIYRYFVGRIDQSISEDSYKRNYKQHETIIFNLIEFYKNSDISDAKRNYILNKLILPMINSHYVILMRFLKSGKKYNSFEKKLLNYPDIYNNPVIVTKTQRLHRKTHGILVRNDMFVRKLGFWIKKWCAK